MIYEATEKNLTVALDLLKSGQIIVYPTDTIYGFGVDATNSKAINKLNILKRRVSPLSIIVDSEEMIKKFVNTNFIFTKVIKNYLPGPFTILIENENKVLPKEVGLDTGKIGVRIPDSDFIIKLVQMINRPIITTSVNVHKSHSLNNVKEISQNFNSIYIFSNSSHINSKGSTIIDCTYSPFKVLRQGDGVI